MIVTAARAFLAYKMMGNFSNSLANYPNVFGNLPPNFVPFMHIKKNKIVCLLQQNSYGKNEMRAMASVNEPTKMFEPTP